MPKPATHALIWNAEDHSYLLHSPDHSLHSIRMGDEGAWYAWLMTHVSFSFQGQHGHLNVFKEKRSRGNGYWYAYQAFEY